MLPGARLSLPGSVGKEGASTSNFQHAPQVITHTMRPAAHVLDLVVFPALAASGFVLVVERKSPVTLPRIKVCCFAIGFTP